MADYDYKAVSYTHLDVYKRQGRAYHEFRAASGITIGNAYSALRNYYHDYSIFGVILFNYILTFVFSIKYYDLKYCSDITYKKAFSLTLYASFIYTVFFQFFTRCV